MIDNNTRDLINTFLNLKNQLGDENEDIGLQKLIAASILNNIILSKKIFKRNFMIGKFLEKYFSIHLSKYVLASRTMISGKVTRYVFALDNYDEFIDFLNSLYNILTKLKENRDIFDSDIYDVIMGMKI